MTAGTVNRGAARLFALIQQLELRRGELEQLLGPMPPNGPIAPELEAALSALAEAIELLRGLRTVK